MPLPPLDQIKFFDDYPDNSSDYQISVIPFETDMQLGSTTVMFDESKLVEIHVYVRALSEDEPEEVGEIQKEIERIIMENPLALINEGISLMQVLDYRQIFEGDNTSTMWHYVFDIQLFYRKYVHVNES